MNDKLVLRRHSDASELIAQRARLLAGLRDWMGRDGFIEVEVPALMPSAGQEAHLHPPRVDVPGLPQSLWLQTSPELGLKRLLCAGAEKIYSLGWAFRGGREELSSLHQPQFCLLEWYRPGTSLSLLQDDVVGLGEAASVALGVESPKETRVVSLADIYKSCDGPSYELILDGDIDKFCRQAETCGWGPFASGLDVATVFSQVMVDVIEPWLARQDGWVFVMGYPAFQAGLAQLDPVDERVALRMEAYLGGIEIANGYVELSDPREHHRRWGAEMAVKGEGAFPELDQSFLSELEREGLSPTVGMALGVDRCALALLGKTELNEVLPFFLSVESTS